MSVRLLLFFTAIAAAGQDYFPLQQGNQWVYRQTVGVGTSEGWTIDAGDTQSFAGNEYFRLNGFPQRTPLWVRQAGSRLVFYDQDAGRERPWVDFGAAINDRFPAEIDPCNSTASIAERGVEVKLAIGTFADALRITYLPSCADAGITEEIYVPGIGLAKRTYTTIAGPRTYELAYARVGGFTVVSEGEHSFYLTLDKAAYPRGTAILARITLRNTTGRALRLTFPSGQDFDIVIRNSAGQQVWRWSDGRAFTQAVRILDFEGERNWVEDIALDLPAGDYTATASLAITDGRYESTMPLRISPAR